MKIATVKMKSVSPMSQSKYVNVPKLDKEQPAAYEQRTWREKMHYDKDGQVYIPPMAFKNTLSGAAKYLSIQYKGKSTYTKHFEAGVLCYELIYLGIHKQDVSCESFFLPSDGRRGGTTRVVRTFPVFPEWEGTCIFNIADEIITEKVFRMHLEAAGQFIGIGRFRPRNNGFYGRFEIISLDWE